MMNGEANRQLLPPVTFAMLLNLYSLEYLLF